jgi:hypothetical protein
VAKNDAGATSSELVWEECVAIGYDEVVRSPAAVLLASSFGPRLLSHSGARCTSNCPGISCLVLTSELRVRLLSNTTQFRRNLNILM